ncbi:MAG TPA: GAP family protein [Solirubrobacterales bacterium]
MDFLTILPLAFVMIAGPQIISAFFFATSDSWGRSSAAYVLGAILSITLVTGAAYLLGVGATGEGDTSEGTHISTIDAIILLLLLFAMFKQFQNRNQTEPPKWMGKLESATPKFAFTLGFLLLGVFPSDLVTSISIGGHTADRGDSYLTVLPFIGLTALLLATPALLVLLLGSRAKALLPKIRDWMDSNSWIISEVVLVFFIVIILSGG